MDAANEAPGRGREVQQMLHAVKNIQYPLHQAIDFCDASDLAWTWFLPSTTTTKTLKMS